MEEPVMCSCGEIVDFQATWACFKLECRRVKPMCADCFRAHKANHEIEDRQAIE